MAAHIWHKHLLLHGTDHIAPKGQNKIFRINNLYPTQPLRATLRTVDANSFIHPNWNNSALAVYTDRACPASLRRYMLCSAMNLWTDVILSWIVLQTLTVQLTVFYSVSFPWFHVSLQDRFDSFTVVDDELVAKWPRAPEDDDLTWDAASRNLSMLERL